MWLIFKVIHVSAILLGVGLSLGTELLLFRIARSRDVLAIRAGFALAAPLLKTAIPLYMVGLVMGLSTVWTGGWSFVAPWLVISYVIFALMIVLNLGLRAPWATRVLATARASADGEPSAELRATLADPRAAIHLWAAPVAIVSQVFLMIVKPFG
ncbi:MAG TPA: DUF2269 family protein [Polyangiaceae bacterium]|jgi:uncharacterized membrane protein|nr:DUF2269 family protein [Polyangiaceae bacterium]